MIEGVLFKEDFIENSLELLDYLIDNIVWDERMAARKTASFGVAYNYSQIAYPYKPIPSYIQEISDKLISVIGFAPNNCLINYYKDGSSKMGFHSDQTDILYEHTGITIVSLGASRIIKFKKIADPEASTEYLLPTGSLLYMTQEVQNIWQHAIPKSDTQLARISLTFRKIIEKL